MSTTLDDIQYKILLDLFNEFNEDFWKINPKLIEAFFNRLYAK